MTEKPTGETRTVVRSAARVLAIIEAMGTRVDPMGISEIAGAIDEDRFATRRLVQTLETLGYAQRDGRRYRLTAKVLNLGQAYLASLPLWHVAEPVLEQVVSAVGVSCSMAVLDGTDAVYVARVPTRRILDISLSVGTRLPAYCNSMGRTLMAFLPDELLESCLAATSFEKFTPKTTVDPAVLREKLVEIRRQGWCLIDEEMTEGVRSVAVPVRNHHGTVVAAINASGYVSRIDVDRAREALIEAATRLRTLVSRR